MGDVYKKARNLFENELEKIVSKGDMTPANLELTYKVIDIIKDITEICAMDNSDYGYDDEYSGRHSYRRGYSMNYPYRNNYSGNSMLVSKLHNLMNEAGNDRERMMIQNWLNEIEN